MISSGSDRKRSWAIGALALAATLAIGGLAHAAAEMPKVAQPKIPSKTFAITEYGAVPDGKTLATEAVKKAISAAHSAGGGIVVIPAGKFLTGPFSLESNIELRVEKDARLLLINDVDTYPKDSHGYIDWITARGAHDIAITGEGTIDGQGQPWWDKYRKRNGVAPTGLPHRPQMFRLSDCQRVLVKDVHLTDSPNFHLIPQKCQDVTIDHITITAPDDAPNTDGIDPSGDRFHITGCTIDTGDDNIAIKPATRGDKPSCEDFLVENCTFKHGHGMSIGGQTPGGLKRLTVRNCSFEGTEAGIRMKAPRGQGGLVEDCTYENLTMKKVKVPVLLTSWYPKIPSKLAAEKPEEVKASTPIWRHIRITNVTSTDSPEAGQIAGLPEMPIEDVVFKNVHISAEKGMRVGFAKAIKFEDSSITAAKGPALIIDGEADVAGLSK